MNNTEGDIEIIQTVRTGRRRYFTKEEKSSILDSLHSRGMTISLLARKYDIHSGNIIPMEETNECREERYFRRAKRGTSQRKPRAQEEGRESHKGFRRISRRKTYS